MIAGLIAAGLGKLEIFSKPLILLFSIELFFVTLISIFAFSNFESSKIFLSAILFAATILFVTSLLLMVSMMSSKDAPDFIQRSIIKISF